MRVRVRVRTVIALAAIATGLAVGAPRVEARAQLGKRAPALSLPGLAKGQKGASLDKLAGHAVLVSFFASWCKPCKKELPVLARLQRKYRKRGLVVLVVSVDEDRAAGVRFAARHARGLVALWDGKGAAAARYALPKMPTSFVIDGKRIVRRINRGFTAKDERAIDAAVRAALP